MVDFYWSLYAWNFETKKIIVLDPLHMDLGPNVLSKKHKISVSWMHESMCECMKKEFPNEDMTGRQST